MKQKGYQKRDYRQWTKSSDLIGFEVTEFETDLYILAEQNLYKEALKSIKFYRNQLIDYIKTHPEFETSLVPILIDNSAPEIVKQMGQAAESCGVGPFAAVAGAMSEYVGRDLLRYSEQIIVENGGDIFISSNTDRNIAIYAGDSPFSGKIALEIKQNSMPAGICTSSGTVGHSLSFGRADAVIIMSPSAALADAVATATTNKIQSPEDIEKAVDFAANIHGITGIAAIMQDKMGIWGDFKIIRINN